ncbi:MAG: hypothetical protein AAB853_05690 [Patescibacteria group bacterium]
MSPNPTRLRILRILFRITANVGVVVFLRELLPTSFLLSGGIKSAVAMSLLFTLLNAIVLPLLRLIVLPIRLLATLIATVLVNIAFLWITVQAVSILAIPGFTFAVGGGIAGWLIVSAALGLSNGLVRMIAR